MNKNFMVAGSGWVAEVPLENVEVLDFEQVKKEAATRAIEALFKKRSDIEIQKHETPREDMEVPGDEINNAIVELLTSELQPGCGVGMILCVMDHEHPEFTSGGNHEWYISSKEILENVGLPSLVKKFEQKSLINN